MDPLWSHIGKNVLKDPFGHPMEMPFVQVDLRVGESTGKSFPMGHIRKWATPCSLRYASRKHCELRKALYRHRKTSKPTNTTKNSFVWKQKTPQSGPLMITLITPLPSILWPARTELSAVMASENLYL